MRCAAGLLLPTILLLHAYSRRMRTFAKKGASALWMEETRNSKKLEKSVEDDSSRGIQLFQRVKGKVTQFLLAS